MKNSRLHRRSSSPNGVKSKASQKGSAPIALEVAVEEEVVDGALVVLEPEQVVRPVALLLLHADLRADGDVPEGQRRMCRGKTEYSNAVEFA